MTAKTSVWQHAPNLFQHMCQLDFTKESSTRRMVGIIATIGPSSQNVTTIYEMLKAGMTIARFNFAYGTLTEHTETINCIKEAVQLYSQELGYNYPLGIAGDLKGRAIQTGSFQVVKSVDLKTGDMLKVTVNELLSDKQTKDAIYLDYPNLLTDVRFGQPIILGENDIELEVTEVGIDVLLCRVTRGGQLNSRVNAALPGVPLSMPPISERDEKHIEFCIKHRFDFLFLSKIRDANDVETVRLKLGAHNKKFKIISKMESETAFMNLDQIMRLSDGVIISRADMCIELPLDKIFLAQKAIAARCNKLGKPVIVGHQLLLSMTNSAVPKRSDLSDIGTALLDGADCLLLSSETAVGKYPVEAVKVLVKTCKEAEVAIWQRKFFEQMCAYNPSATDGAHAVAITAVSTSLNVMAAAIVVVTVSGRSALLLSVYRPRCPIFAVTRCPNVARKMQICRGITPIIVPNYKTDDKTNDKTKNIEMRIDYALTIANRMGAVDTGDAVVVLSPWRKSTGFTNNVHILYAQFDKPYSTFSLEKPKRDTTENKPVKKNFRF